MELTIRKAVADDLPRIMEIFRLAGKFMASTGNPNQWINGYPQQSFIEEETDKDRCYVCTTPDNEIAATFCLIPGPDPTYNKIYNGRWLNDEPYHVIHRLASDGSVKGIGKICIDWCIGKCNDLRIDTHEDNHIMQSLIKRCGFIKCGIIYIANGTPRIAYQRTCL